MSARGNSWGWFEGWMGGRYENEGAAEVVFLEVALKIGGGVMAWFFMLVTPMHKEAVGQPAEHAHDPKAMGTADAAAVVILRDVQAQMETIFNIPSQSIVVEPGLGIEAGRFQTGDQAYQFIVAAGALTTEPGGLFGERETQGFAGGGRRLDRPAFPAGFIPFHRPGRLRRGLPWGKNPLLGRVSVG